MKANPLTPKESQYLRFPLLLIKNSKNPKDFFLQAANFSAVNAGIAFKKKQGEEGFLTYIQGVFAQMDEETSQIINDELDELDFEKDMRGAEEAIVGASICGIVLDDLSGYHAWKTYEVVADRCVGSPIVSVKRDFFLNAHNTAIHEVYGNSKSSGGGISWREWRILVAIYSLKPNLKEFCCAGWESISRRACGFHNKDKFYEFESLPAPWPDHCLPLSRRQTTQTVKRLESLRFFIRHRISSGKVGGMMAYSIRHESREQLAKDCEEWQAFNRGETIKENRAQDYLLHAKAVSKRAQRIEKTLSEGASILETHKSNQYTPLIEPLESSLQVENQALNQPTIETCTSDVQLSVQAPAQPHEQHNEKYQSEKYTSKKYSSNPAGIISLQQGHSEEGYTFEGRFVLSVDASRLMIQYPDIWKCFRRAKRITSSEGIESIEELAESPPL